MYTFSTAREADANGVFALYKSLIGTPGCTWSDDYPTYDLVERDIRTGSLYILRDELGALIAAAAAGPDDELREFHWDAQNPCELARVAVALSRQNRGIGSCLLQRVIPRGASFQFHAGPQLAVDLDNQRDLAAQARRLVRLRPARLLQ